MVLPQLNLRLREVLTSRSSEMRKSFLQVLFPVHKTISPYNTKAVMALLLTILRASFKPHLRHGRVLLHALSAKEHPTEVPRSERGIPSLRRVILGGLILPRIWWVALPNLTCDAHKVVSRCMEVAHDPAGPVSAGRDTTARAVNTTLVEDLA